MTRTHYRKRFAARAVRRQDQRDGITMLIFEQARGQGQDRRGRNETRAWWGTRLASLREAA